ncbi:MAG: hypothetical protein ABI707_05150 [Ferruginibacter sp.]
MKNLLIIFAFILTGLAAAQPISLHPDNPHYFLYKGKPTVLIASAEHYGAVINASLNHKQYPDVLQRFHFNLSRIFPGSYYEGKYYEDAQNTFIYGIHVEWNGYRFRKSRNYRDITV